MLNLTLDFNACIYLSDLRSILNITNKESFADLVDNMFLSFACKTVLGKSAFNEFTQLPIFISNKIFNCLAFKQENYLREACLNLNTFKNFLMDLYMGSFEKVAELIFGIYDFDHDGLITSSNVFDIVRQ